MAGRPARGLVGHSRGLSLKAKPPKLLTFDGELGRELLLSEVCKINCHPGKMVKRGSFATSPFLVVILSRVSIGLALTDQSAGVLSSFQG